MTLSIRPPAGSLLAGAPEPASSGKAPGPRAPATTVCAGFSLLELLVSLVVLGITAALAVPALLEWSARGRLDLAAAELVSTLRLTRLYALRHSAGVAVKFHTAGGGEIRYQLFADGDGDGVRNDDLVAGIDPSVSPPRPLVHFGRGVRFGFPAEATPSDPSRPSRPLDRLDDPIRFNRSDLASFGALGTATPGSLYITDGRQLTVVRVVNRTGRVRVMRWDPETDSWSE